MIPPAQRKRTVPGPAPGRRNQIHAAAVGPAVPEPWNEVRGKRMRRRQRRHILNSDSGLILIEFLRIRSPSRSEMSLLGLRHGYSSGHFLLHSLWSHTNHQPFISIVVLLLLLPVMYHITIKRNNWPKWSFFISFFLVTLLPNLWDKLIYYIIKRQKTHLQYNCVG